MFSPFQRMQCVAYGMQWYIILDLGRDDHGHLALAVPCKDGYTPVPSEPARLIRWREEEQLAAPKTTTPTPEGAGACEDQNAGSKPGPG